MSPIEQSGTPLAAAMLGGLGDAGEMDTEDEEEGGNEREFDEPLCALVKNCNMLHNIVGPACIFLRQSFAQSQLVCIYPHYKHTTQTYRTARIVIAKISHKSFHPSISKVPSKGRLSWSWGHRHGSSALHLHQSRNQTVTASTYPIFTNIISIEMF